MMQENIYCGIVVSFKVLSPYDKRDKISTSTRGEQTGLRSCLYKSLCLPKETTVIFNISYTKVGILYTFSVLIPLTFF